MFSINSFHNVSRDMFTGGAPRLCALQVVASHPHAACVQYIGMRFMFVQLVFDRMRQKPNKQGNTEQKRDNSSKLKKSFLNVTYGVVGTTTRPPVGGLAKTKQNQPKSSLLANTGQKIWPRTRLEVG